MMRRLLVITSWILLAALMGLAPVASAQALKDAGAKAFHIDLPTALRLAGAQNLDVQLARERLAEARANHEIAVNQFFPWITPGLAYRRHDDNIQDVGGNILDVNKQSYTVGGAFSAQVDLGDAWYKSLATRQYADAASHAFDAQRLESIFNAATGYFELARARSAVGVANEALRIARDYADELDRAVEVGVAFKGDALRARVQADRDDLSLRQAQEQQRVAASRLAQVLHLDATVELAPDESDLAPITMVATNAALDSLVVQALVNRPELKESKSLMLAAQETRNGAVYGPLVPSLGASVFLGGLGGGRNGSVGNFGDTEDYFLGVSWRVGPGGIFDRSRIRAAESRAASVQLGADKLYDQIIGQVVENHTHAHSLSDQIGMAKRALTSAEATLRLTRERKEFAVGIVLENILAEQELTRARNDYLNVIAEYNKAQYGLSRAIGTLISPAKSSEANPPPPPSTKAKKQK